MKEQNNIIKEKKKKCNTCKQDKSIIEFRKRKKAKDGLTYSCKDCLKQQDKNNYINNKERYKNYWNDNKEKKIKYDFKYFNEEKTIIERKEYYQNNKEKRNNYIKERKKSNPQVKLAFILRGRLLEIIKKHKTNKSKSALKLLGCTIEEFKQHLESQFLPEMSWENHGIVWEIDHIKPCASFDLTDIEQQKQCFHYTNSQPLFKTTRIAESFGYMNYIGNKNKNKFNYVG